MLGLQMRPPPFILTSDSPSSITSISPKSSLSIQDFDGAGQTWTLAAPCSKVAIFNSKNLTLIISSKVLTGTIELWASSDVSVVVSPPPVAAESEGPSPLTVLLDPTLSSVSLSFANPSLVSSIILSPTLSGDSFGFRDVALAIEGKPQCVLANKDGELCEPQEPRRVLRKGRDDEYVPVQWVVKIEEDGGWSAATLRREEQEYPVLNQT